jgi:hypothetical protein
VTLLPALRVKVPKTNCAALVLPAVVVLTIASPHAREGGAGPLSLPLTRFDRLCLHSGATWRVIGWA